MSGLFSGIEQARTSEGGVYLTPGNYTLEIQAVKTGRTRQNRNFFVVEFNIIESDVPDRKAGMNASWMTMLDFDAALGNIKKFVAVAAGVEIADVDEPGVEAVVSESNPLKGTKIRCQAVNVKTQRGGDFTKVTFFPFAN